MAFAVLKDNPLLNKLLGKKAKAVSSTVQAMPGVGSMANTALNSVQKPRAPIDNKKVTSTILGAVPGVGVIADAALNSPQATPSQTKPINNNLISQGIGSAIPGAGAAASVLGKTYDLNVPTASSQDDALKKLLATGQYETYKDANGNTSVKLKQTSSAPTAANNMADYLTGNSTVDNKTNELIDKLLGGLNATPYDQSKDTDYQNYKADMLKQADTAYDNTNAEYLGNQSGNFNSAAQQIASSAKNDLINKADLAAPEFEDRYNTEQRQKQNDTLNMVNTLLGIETRNQNAEDKAKSDYAATANQYYDDFQAEINKIKGDNDPTNDWKAGILGSLRQEKIQTQKANQAALDKAAAEAAAKGNQQTFENALKLWQTEGPANPTVAKILGVPEGASTKDYDVAKINAAINQAKLANDTAKTKYEINKPYYNPNSGSGSGSGKIDQNSVNFNDVQSSLSAYGKSLLASPSFKQTDLLGKTTQKYGVNSVPYVSGVGERIKEYVDGGLLTKDQANQLSTQILGKNWDDTVKVVKYNQAVNALSSGDYAKNPQDAYKNVLANKDLYTSQMGQSYYNSLLNKYWQASKKQATKGTSKKK